MSEFSASPDAAYERLLGNATDSRRIRSLGAINQACRMLYERGSTNFSLRTVVELGKQHGLPVPSEKSIVNSTGLHYRELIQAWRLAAVPQRSSRETEAWINQIKDPVLRMSAALQAKELRAMRSKQARQTKVVGASIVIASSEISLQPNQNVLNGAELAALQSAISPTNLRLLGLVIGDRGEVIDTNGREIQKPGFRDAIEKILSLYPRN
jgi:hypothetical protein